MRKLQFRWLGLVLGGVILASLFLLACGGSGNGGGDSSSGAVSGSDLKRYETELNEVYKGTYTKPSGGPVNPPAGKNVWVISTGQSIETAQNASKAMEEAGEKLGWTVKTFDGKFESSREIAGIEQALASGADGLVLLYVDCAPVKSALQQAKAAGVKVVGIESQDCSPSLEYEQKFANGDGYLDWEHGWGGTQAKWVIAKTKGEAKTIVTVETDLEVTKAGGRGIEEQFKQCSTCEIVDTVNFVGTEFGPPLQQKIEQALNKHPEANSFIAAYDAVLTGGGGAAALRGSGRLNEISIMGGEGSVPGIELIYNEAGNDACAGIPTAWNGYEAIMVLARAFAGQDPSKGDSGIGWQACDKEHNLPPKGESYQAPIDFVSAYEELWGLK
ncbi:MAG: sugar ABC transporter substrate-binding protein [Solirubrobacterales bacterium]